MLSSRPGGIAVLVLALGFSVACGKSPGVPGGVATTNSQAVPFAHESPSGSSSSSAPPLATSTSLPEGTPITIRLVAQVSSVSAHAGDTFNGLLDDPIEVEDQTAVARGAAVTGRVLAAKASTGPRDPGYLRIALIDMTIDGKRVTVETSSLFIKGGGRGRRDRSSAGAARAATASNINDVAFGPERRVVFRLAQTVAIP
jgi:hypothetical protein